MIANRRSRGRTSRKSSSRLPARSDCWVVNPVTLPPGCAKLPIRSPPTGSIPNGKTMGMTDVACFHCGGSECICDNDIDLQADKFGCNFGVTRGTSLRPAILNRNSAILDPAEFTQSLHKSSSIGTPSRSVRAQEPDGWQLARLLRASGERPCNHSTAEKSDEFPSPHGFARAED